MSAPEFTVTDLDRRSRQTLLGWLADAAKAGIEVDDPSSIQDAYEAYFDRVLATAPADREDPTPTLTMIGIALGEHLQRGSRLVWRIVSDAHGSDLGLATPDGSGAFFPADPVAANWGDQRREWIVPFVEEMLVRLSHDHGSADERGVTDAGAGAQ